VWSGGALLAAAQVLAGADAARESGRWQATSVEFAGSFFLPVENLVTLVAAHALGGGREEYYGRWLLYEVIPFVGASTLVLAALARGRRAAVEGAIVAAAFLVALGPQLPFYETVFHLVPGFQIFRAPARLAAAALPFLALLAARGLDRARKGGLPRFTPAAVALSAAAMAGLAWLPGDGAWGAFIGILKTAPVRQVTAGHLDRPEVVAVLRAAATRELLAAAAVLAACALLLAAARRHPRAAYVMALVAGGELGVFAAAHRSTAPPVMPYPPLWREAAAGGGDVRVRHVLDAFSNQGMVRGHLDVWGYDASVPARYSDLLAAMGEVAEREGDGAPRLRGANAMLRWRYLFGVRPDGAPALLDLGEPLPRVLLVEEVRVVPDRADMLRTLLDAGFDPWRTALLETPPEPWPDRGAGGPAGKVRVLQEGTDILDLEVEAPRATVLLVTDAFSRGWQARSLAAGAPTRYQVLPANLALRAVPLPAGRHRLRLEYAPAGFRAGRVISMLALLAWMSGLALVLPSRTLTGPPAG
jgi:hypothetical protein